MADTVLRSRPIPIDRDMLREAITVIEGIPDDRLSAPGCFGEGDDICPAIAVALHWKVGTKDKPLLAVGNIGSIIAASRSWAWSNIVWEYDLHEHIPAKARDRVVANLRNILAREEARHG